MKTSIVLTGFMGTGKTEVGKRLARKLGKEFIETDALIEKKAGRSIAEIFRRDGEIGFRELEIEAVKDIAGGKNAVIACGGGIVLNTINIDRLRQECIIVCLTASPAAVLKRTSSDKGERPLLAVADRQQQIKDMLKYRRPFYARAADITINTSRLKPDEVVERIIEEVKRHESYHS
jgi:shikimate kinase